MAAEKNGVTVCLLIGQSLYLCLGCVSAIATSNAATVMSRIPKFAQDFTAYLGEGSALNK